MSHLKTHVARMLGVMSLLATLLVFAIPAMSASAATKDPVQPCSVGSVSYKGTASISTSNPNPQPNDTIHIIGTGFPPHSSVPLFANGVSIGTAITNAHGDFNFPYKVPKDTPENTTITFTADCGPVKPTTSVQVSAVAIATTVPASTEPLPRTGSASTLPLLAAGVAFVVIGGLIVLSMRKRTQRASHSA